MGATESFMQLATIESLATQDAIKQRFGHGALVLLVATLSLSGPAIAQVPDVPRLKDGSQPNFAACEGEYDEQPWVTQIARPIPPSDLVWRYEQFALRYDMYWKVRVKFDVDTKGRPRNIRSEATDPSMIAKAANATLAAWRFRPAIHAGKAVPARCQVLLEYDLRTSKMKQEQAARDVDAGR